MSQTDTQKQTKALEDIRALLQAILKRLDTLEPEPPPDPEMSDEEQRHAIRWARMFADCYTEGSGCRRHLLWLASVAEAALE